VADIFEQLGLEERRRSCRHAARRDQPDPFDVARCTTPSRTRLPLAAAGGSRVVDERTTAQAPELEVAELHRPSGDTLDRMMIEVMQRGTGRAARSQLPPGLVVAGKTGTSNDYRTAGSRAFRVVTGRRLGRPRRQQPTGLTGTTGGLAVWSRLMGSIVTSSFEPMLPESLEHRWVDYFSGLETSPYCDGAAVSLPFRVGTLLEPNPGCPPDTSEPPRTTACPRRHPRSCRRRPGFP